MITKRWLPLLLIALLLLVACNPTTTTSTTPIPTGQGTLTVAFLDVGQGDSTLIRSPNGTIMLIDGGRSTDLAGQVIIPQLKAWGADHVDVLIPTHPDSDHITGLVGVYLHLSVVPGLADGEPMPDNDDPAGGTS